MVFARTVDASPDHPGVLSFRYDLPGAVQSVAGGHLYQLAVQHQPMVNPVQLTVHVTLPAGSSARSLSPGWTVLGNVATLTVTLTADFVAQLGF